MSAHRAALVFMVSLALGLGLTYTGLWWPLVIAGLAAGLLADRYLHSLLGLAGGALASLIRVLIYLGVGAPAFAEAVAAAEVAGIPTITIPLVTALVPGALEAAGCLIGTFIMFALRR
ncbi:MAG: hypothetical protein ACP5HK_06710 [Acidilobus sp.]